MVEDLLELVLTQLLPDGLIVGFVDLDAGFKSFLFDSVRLFITFFQVVVAVGKDFPLFFSFEQFLCLFVELGFIHGGLLVFQH